MGMRYYSHSGLSAFEQCPYRYKLAYVDRVKTGEESIACLRGSAAHFGIEWIYEQMLGGTTPTLGQALDVTRHWWRDQMHDGLLNPSEDMTPDDYLAQAEACIRNYYARYEPFDQDKTLAIEKRIKVGLDPRHGIVGYADRVVRRNGHYEIHDYKTGARKGRHKDIFDNRQLALYAMGIRAEYPDAATIKLVWHYVQIDAVHEAAHSADEYEKLRQATLRLIEKIETARTFPRRSGWLCKWCDYATICRSRP